jgi:hypothetical protein
VRIFVSVVTGRLCSTKCFHGCAVVGVQWTMGAMIDEMLP